LALSDTRTSVTAASGWVGAAASSGLGPAVSHPQASSHSTTAA
jgi:hypothetical protein